MIDGHEPGDAGFVLTTENTPAVRAWLISEGLDPARVEGMRNDSLAKAYRYPAYLRQMKTRADYYPSCAKPKENTPCNAIPLPYQPVGQQPLSTTTTAALTTKTPPKPNGAAPSSNTSPGMAGQSSQMSTTASGSHGIIACTTAEPIATAAMSSTTPCLGTAAEQRDVERSSTGQLLTEQRIVELIEEHAVRVLLERLQLMELLK